MSKIYTLIEDQVSNIVRIILEDEDTGELKFGSFIKGPKWVKPAISIITAFVFLFIALFFGLYLWNYGLAPVFPSLVAKIDPVSRPDQAGNPYVQLFLTLIALMMFV